MRRANGRGRRGRRKVVRTPWPDLDENALLVAPLVAGEEQLGILCCLAAAGTFTDEDEELIGAVANQTAVGLKKAELIERLTAENTVKDMFDALATGSVEAAEGKARGGELRPRTARTLFLHVEPARRWRRARGGLVRAGRDSSRPSCGASAHGRLFDSRPDRVRALAPLPGGQTQPVERLRAACDPLGRRPGTGDRAERGRPERG